MRDYVNRITEKVRWLDRKTGTQWSAAEERAQRRNITHQLRERLIEDEDAYIRAYRERTGKPDWEPNERQQEMIYNRVVQTAGDWLLDNVREYVKTPVVNTPLETADDALIADVQEAGELFNEPPPPPPTNATQMLREFFQEEAD